jgi:hypothetical protein
MPRPSRPNTDEIHFELLKDDDPEKASQEDRQESRKESHKKGCNEAREESCESG